MWQPPDFWQKQEGKRHPLARALKPVSYLYEKLGARRIHQAVPYRAAGPVICIGNVSMGGVGKTPFALMTAGLLKKHGFEPAFLTRGYGGRMKEPGFVTEALGADQTGDEAQLLARSALTCVSPDREAGARQIFEGSEATALIMDDGFQNPSLVKDFSVLLIDGEAGFGNGEVFPSGPLRERPQSALARAHAVVFVVPEKSYELAEPLRGFAGETPVFRAWLAPEPAQQPQDVFAFCGIGRPEKFYRTAHQAGYHVVGRQAFADHHAYQAGELETLAQLAEQAGARLLTTEKDHVRLPPAFQKNVLTLPVTMQLDNEPRFVELMLSAMKAQSIARN